MSKPDVQVIGPADLRVKCLCGCKQVVNFEGATLTLQPVINLGKYDHEPDEFVHYKVTSSIAVMSRFFTRPAHTFTSPMVQIKGETTNAVFALPCVAWVDDLGGWVSVADPKGAHFAIRSKIDKSVRTS